MIEGLKGAWKAFRSATNRVAMVLSVIAALSTIALMVSVIADVISRRSGSGSLPGMMELSESLLVIMTFLGMAQAERVSAHVRTTLLTDRLPDVARMWVQAGAYVIYFAIVAWWAYASVLRAVESTQRSEYRTGILEFPVYPARIVLAIGMVALAFLVLVRLVEVLTKYEVEEPQSVASLGL
jgi:TRAP-type C4-dicarboxylate transport system permease small subunit